MAAINLVSSECAIGLHPFDEEHPRYECQSGNAHAPTCLPCVLDWCRTRSLNTCPNPGCSQDITYLLPKRERVFRKISQFFSQPIVKILTVAIPILTINVVAGASVAAGVGGVVIAGALAANAGLAVTGALAGAAVAAGAAASDEVSVGFGFGIAQTGVILAGAGAGVAVTLARGHMARRRDYFAAGVATAAALMLSTHINLPDTLLEITFGATSAASTYFFTPRVL